MPTNVRMHPYPGSAETCELCRATAAAGSDVELQHFEGTFIVMSPRPAAELVYDIADALNAALKETDETWYWK